MSFTNSPVNDLLIRIKNAYMARRENVTGVIYSNLKKNVLELLRKYSFIKDYEIVEKDKKKVLNVLLFKVHNPKNDVPVIKFYSKPSRRWYVSYKDITPVAGGKGIGIISTSKGIMATHEAKENKIGGELIAEIY